MINQRSSESQTDSPPTRRFISERRCLLNLARVFVHDIAVLSLSQKQHWRTVVLLMDSQTPAGFIGPGSGTDVFQVRVRCHH